MVQRRVLVLDCFRTKVFFLYMDLLIIHPTIKFIVDVKFF